MCEPAFTVRAVHLCSQLLISDGPNFCQIENSFGISKLLPNFSKDSAKIHCFDIYKICQC
ncbi:unnamed protein product [Ixodes persulcatus]